uniref:MAGE domain-containing protein n=1 Tax=Rhizochromulina marina TaxID=1034831 RepID=A0A7S2WVH9_9STRA
MPATRRRRGPEALEGEQEETTGKEAQRSVRQRQSREQDAAGPQEYDLADGMWNFTQTQVEPWVLTHDDTMPMDDTLPIGPDEEKMLVSKMSRYVLMKGSHLEPIQTSKLNEEVLGAKYRKKRNLARQILARAAAHVNKTFGYRLLRVPETRFPQPRFKDCYFLVNGIQDGPLRTALGREQHPAMKGLLMVVFAAIYASNHNSQNNRTTETHLVAYLDKIDTMSKAVRQQLFGHQNWSDVLATLCRQHYLLKTMQKDPEGNTLNVLELGPRAFLEVGRKQIVYFIHEAVGEDVDRVVLEELEESAAQDQECQ